MKKIVTILITLALIFSLTACGEEVYTTADTQKPTMTVYLKWSDGEELLENVKHINHINDRLVEIVLEDGSQIITGYANVIIIKK